MDKKYVDKMYNTWMILNDKKFARLWLIEDAFHNSILLNVKEKYPKKRIVDYQKAGSMLSPEEFAEIKEHWQTIFNNTYSRYDKFKMYLESKLIEYSKEYVITQAEDLYKIKSVNGGDYHTQGFGANKYARGHLESDKMLLELNGFECIIKETKVSDPDNWGMRYIEYELWSNITPKDFQFMKWKGQFISVLNWAVLCWRKRVNPKVYFPFLSDKDYEQSQVLANDHNYVITKENMMLEKYE